MRRARFFGSREPATFPEHDLFWGPTGTIVPVTYPTTTDSRKEKNRNGNGNGNGNGNFCVLQRAMLR